LLQILENGEEKNRRILTYLHRLKTRSYSANHAPLSPEPQLAAIAP
jgi:hypothetical protein